MKVSFALYQPEIPQNVGTILRTASCFGMTTHIIEPCGFVWDDKKLQRAGMDYLDTACVMKHQTFEDFLNHIDRLVLLDTKGCSSVFDFQFQKGDCLLLGKESTGVPDSVFHACAHNVSIPMLPERRSLNVAIAGAITLGFALGQLNLQSS